MDKRRKIAIVCTAVAAASLMTTTGVAVGWHLGVKNAPVRTVYSEAQQIPVGQEPQGSVQEQLTAPYVQPQQPRKEHEPKQQRQSREEHESKQQAQPREEQQSQEQVTGYIDVEVAKQTAMDYVRITQADEPYFTKARLDREDGRMVYEIEFYVGTTEYDVDVDAVTGVVTDVDIDTDEWFD